MISFTNVSKYFADRVLFEGMNLTISEQMRLGLIGSNGVGKTTILRMITGDEFPNNGKISARNGIQIGYISQEIETMAENSILEETLSVKPEIREMESKIQELTQVIAADPSDEKMYTKLGKLQTDFENCGGYDLEQQAIFILSGLGFQNNQMRQSTATLSGGWKMRVALARILLLSPDLLLLDEPTNHLDLESIVWLEEFLQKNGRAMVIISHDRTFLNKLATHVAELKNREITLYTGNLEQAEKFKAERDAYLLRQAKNQEKAIAQTERFIERFRAKNTLATRVKSKIKQLEKMDRVELSKEDNKRISIVLPPVPRSALNVFEAENVGFAYGDKQVYKDLDFVVERGERLALVGPNGAGKSTLLKLIAGILNPQSGSAGLGTNVLRQYYAQHQLDILSPQATVLESVERLCQGMQHTQVRSYLGSFLFRGDDIQKKVEVLSGGEKSRLALARILLHPANLLLLDEPTNHLDIQTTELLCDALEKFEGSLVVISHDRHFLNRVCNLTVEITEGGVRKFLGNYDYYKWKLEEEANKAEAAKPQENENNSREDFEKRKAEKRKAERKAKEIKNAESEIESIENKISVLKSKLNNPANSSKYSELEKILQEIQSLESALETAYNRWEQISDG